MNLSGPPRDWDDARAKVDEEDRCRNCRKSHELDGVKLETAHTIGRRHDEFKACSTCDGSGRRLAGAGPCTRCKGSGASNTRYVHPDSVIPLCEKCHKDQHAGKVELLPLMNAQEQAYAVLHMDGILAALNVLTIEVAA